MSFENELLEIRHRKIRELEELGFTAYPRKYGFSHSLDEIVSKYADVTGEDLAVQKPGVRVWAGP